MLSCIMKSLSALPHRPCIEIALHIYCMLLPLKSYCSMDFADLLEKKIWIDSKATNNNGRSWWCKTGTQWNVQNRTLKICSVIWNGLNKTIQQKWCLITHCGEYKTRAHTIHKIATFNSIVHFTQLFLLLKISKLTRYQNILLELSHFLYTLLSYF